MQIHVLEEIRPELPATDGAPRRRELEIRRTQSVEPIERLYTFAGWTLDETTRDLMSPAGQRVDLTSSEFDLLMAFLRHPGQPLSRAALLGVLRGASGHISIARSTRWSRDSGRNLTMVPTVPR
jgi:hypothetical protein